MWMLLSACAAAGPPPGVRTEVYEIGRGDGPALAVRATWPEVGQGLPVVVFSHGMGGSKDAYAPLAEAWARAGYLVLQPTHPDSLAGEALRERLAVVRDPASFVRDPERLAAWDDRAREVTLVLDHLGDTAALGLDPARIDPERVGVGGHSFGGHTALVSAGLVPSLADPRTDAILLLSPPGPNGLGRYDGITAPTLLVTGSEDTSPGTPALGPEWRKKVLDELHAADEWLLYLDGADHSLGGIAGVRPPTETRERVIEATLAFWDATLRGSAAARAKLDAATAR